MNSVKRERLRRIQATALTRASHREIALELVVAILAGIWWPAYAWVYIRPAYPDLTLPLGAMALAGWLWQGLVVWNWWRPTRPR